MAPRHLVLRLAPPPLSFSSHHDCVQARAAVSSGVLTARVFRRGLRRWTTAEPKLHFKHARYNDGRSEAGRAAALPLLTTGWDAALERKSASTPRRTGALAIKKGMSAVFMGKDRIPCTVLQMAEVQVLANMTRDRNGYWAVQLGMGTRLPGNVGAPMLGYYEARGVAPKEHVAEFRVRDETGLLPVGAQLLPDWFLRGQHVDARAICKGKGFSGVMKRWGMAGQPASHGNSLNHRTMGSAGPSQGSGSRVHPGKKMAGRMGNCRVTVQNLRVLRTDNALGIVVVSGSIPGHKGCVVHLSDAIKRKPPGPSWTKFTAERLHERDPDLEAKYQDARKLHLKIKALRTGVSVDEEIDGEIDEEIDEAAAHMVEELLAAEQEPSEEVECTKD